MFFLNCDIDIDITYSRPFIFFGFYRMPLYRKVLVRGLVRKLSKIFVSETKRSARKHPEGALGIYTTEPDHARNHQKIPKNQKPLTWRYMTKPIFSLRHRRDPETTSPQGTLPPDLDCELVKGVSPLALLRIARCSLKKSTYTDLTNEVAKKVLHKKASGPMLICESSSLNQSRCF